MRRLALDEIRTDGDTQTRIGNDEATVADYALAMENGEVFPPIVVFKDGATYWLADGFHRVAAARRARLTTLAAEVRRGMRRDALLYSATANTTHGLRRTHADKRRAVGTLLGDKEWGRWSDREIARRCSVSADLVAAVRLTVENDSDTAARTFTTKHGTVATMDVRRIGREPAATTLLPGRRSSASKWSVVVGDAWKLASVPSAQPVQAIVTSPPYYGQRVYGHKTEFGRERTVDEYVAKLASLFGMLRRWMSPTGSLWLNIGDVVVDRKVMGIPTRVALAIAEHGWFWRSEVIYERDNLPPRSSVGCPLRSHEHVLLFSKGEKWYCDDAAMREPAKFAGYHFKRDGVRADDGRLRMDKERIVGDLRTLRSVWRGPTGWNGAVKHPALMPRLMAEALRP